MDHEILRESTFFIGRGGRGFGGEGHQSIFYKLERVKPVLFPTGGGVTVFLGKEKIYPCRLVDSYLLTNTRSV